MEETGPRQRGHQEDGARLLQVGGQGRSGSRVQPGQDSQVERRHTIT